MYWIAVGGAVLALVLAAIGALRVYGALNVLRRRMAGFGDLPVVAAVGRASAQIRELQAQEVQVRELVARAAQALLAMRAGLAQLAGIGSTAGSAVTSCTREFSALRAVFVPRPNSH
jgi:hypothetical protein